TCTTTEGCSGTSYESNIGKEEHSKSKVGECSRETMYGFNRQIKKAIKDEMPKILNTSILKPMYKEFNALNKMESSRQLEAKVDKTSADMTELVGLVSRVVHLMDTSTLHSSATIEGRRNLNHNLNTTPLMTLRQLKSLHQLRWPQSANILDG
nr:hypothetical protein [Tanacetum cinerariifolium]